MAQAEDIASAPLFGAVGGPSSSFEAILHKQLEAARSVVALNRELRRLAAAADVGAVAAEASFCAPDARVVPPPLAAPPALQAFCEDMGEAIGKELSYPRLQSRPPSTARVVPMPHQLAVTSPPPAAEPPTAFEDRRLSPVRVAVPGGARPQQIRGAGGGGDDADDGDGLQEDDANHPFIGRWQDASGEFYGGVVLVVGKTGWRPEGDRHRRSTFDLEGQGHRRVLVEKDKVGREHRYELQHGDEAGTIIARSANSDDGGEWKLERPEQLLKAALREVKAKKASGIAVGGLRSSEREASDADRRGVSGLIFKLLDCWEEDASKRNQCGKDIYRKTNMAWVGHKNTDTLAAGGTKDMHATGSTGAAAMLEDVTQDGVMVSENGCMRHVLQYPNATPRTLWDASSMLLVMWDMVMIPLQFFDPPETGFFQVMVWIARLFWTLDIVASFITGFVQMDGSIEMRAGKIARRYISTWLALDIVIVTADWVEVVVGAGSASMARAGKVSRVFRIIRMIRLLRLLRMKSTISFMLERLQSEQLILVASIVKLVVVICGMGHIVACIWYGLGIASDGAGWVAQSGYTEASFGARYMMSLHWSLSQLTGGMDEVTPENVNERFYCILVFLTAFILASVVVSSITTAMTRLHFIGNQQAQQLAVLRQYMQQNGISRTLAVRVQRSAQRALSEQQRLMPEASVDLLNVVSEALRVEIHFEMHSPMLMMHEFFSCYIDECPQVMRRVCHSAMEVVNACVGDVIFNIGEIPSRPKMYFVISGELEYLPFTGDIAKVNVGDWISEASLWTSWMHRGVLTTVRDCRLLTVDAKKFQEIVNQFEHVTFDPKRYAKDFVDKLNRCQAEATDLLMRAQEDHDDFLSTPQQDDPARHHHGSFFHRIKRMVAPSLASGVSGLASNAAKRGGSWKAKARRSHNKKQHHAGHIAVVPEESGQELAVNAVRSASSMRCSQKSTDSRREAS